MEKNLKSTKRRLKLDWFYFSTPSNRPFDRHFFAVFGRVFLAVITVFYLLNVIAFAIPDNRVLAKVEDDLRADVFSENYPDNGWGGQKDFYTQCIAATIGFNTQDASESAFSKAITIPRGPDCRNISQFFADVHSGNPNYYQQFYYRYWGGFALFTRAGIFLNGWAGANALATLLLISSIITFVYFAAKSLGFIAALSFPATMLISSDLITLATQPTHAITWTAIFAGATLVLLTPTHDLRNVFLAGFVAGSLFVYVDLFTNPPAAFLVVIVLAAAKSAAERQLSKQITLSAVMAGLGWIIAYVFVWMAHWIMAVPLYGIKAVFHTIVEETVFGLRGVYGSNIYVDASDKSAAFRLNLDYWLSSVALTKVAILATVILAICVLIYALLKRGNFRILLPLVGIVVVPVWLYLMPGHSQIHYWFTYRMLSTSLSLTVLVLMLLATQSRDTMGLTDK